MYKNIAKGIWSDPVFDRSGISMELLRLDQVHPVLSGNKAFKLAPHLEQALVRGSSGVLSFGGAYSNHLAALAWACREHGLPCTGIVRGEDDPANPTLADLRRLGMRL